MTGLDLSAPYLRHAGASLARWSWVSLIEGDAAALPFADGTFSLVTCVYLFHELPRAVRRRVAAEMARVLRPGGRLVFVDSFQRGDEPAFDGLLELFPLAYHEPYFADFVRDDLVAAVRGRRAGDGRAERAYMSKVLTLGKAAKPVPKLVGGAVMPPLLPVCRQAAAKVAAGLSRRLPGAGRFARNDAACSKEWPP